VAAWDLLWASPVAFAFTAGLLGLVVGSFLNVVIYRLPRMLQREWDSQCRELLGATPAPESQPLGLARPRSHCPSCGHRITALENIPLLSYMLLRGRCSACGARISPRYPLVELVSGIAAVIAAWHFGPGLAAMGAAVLSWALICLASIDLDHQLLPDVITLPLLWLGLGLSLHGVYVDSHAAIIGAMAGYLGLWLVFQGFKLLTGKEGMGYGDFKLLALLGAWLGWQALPLVVLLSSLVGASVGIAMVVARSRDRRAPIPFGPYLAVAGWVALIWGPSILDAYLDAAGV